MIRKGPRRAPSRRLGSAFLMGLFAVSVIATMVTANTTRAAAELLSANRQVLHAQSFFAAEGGVDCAIRRLRISLNAPQIASVCSNPLQAPTGAAMNVVVQDQGDNVFQITSTSTRTGTTHQARLEAVLQRVDPSQSRFQQAMYGTINVDNTPGILLGWSALVDSYDSGLGAYGGVNVGSNAVVHSGNDIAWCSIYIHNNSLVRGTAYTAPGGSIAHFNTPPQADDPDGNGVTGAIGDREGLAIGEDLPIALSPDAPSGCTSLGNVTVAAGQTLELPDEYYCINSITVQPGGTLKFPHLLHMAVNGNTSVAGAMEVSEGIVSVSGTLYVSNGGVFRGTEAQVDVYTKGMQMSSQGQAYGAGYAPANLRIFNVPVPNEVHSIRMLGQSKLYAAVYSPTAVVRLDDAGTELFGAIIGTQSTVWGSAQLHFDERLKSAGNWPSWLGTDVHVDLLSQRLL